MNLPDAHIIRRQRNTTAKCVQVRDGLGDDKSEKPATNLDAAFPAPEPQNTGDGEASAARQPAPVPTSVQDWEPEGGFAAVAADPSEAALTEVAQRVFGFPGFRGLQLPIIQRVLAGQSTLAIMPTGKPLPCAPRGRCSRSIYAGKWAQRLAEFLAICAPAWCLAYAQSLLEAGLRMREPREVHAGMANLPRDAWLRTS